MQYSSHNKSAEHKTSTEASRLVELHRSFNVPVEQVWKAWSEEDMIRQWWGPHGYSCPYAKIDFRENGKFLLAMEGPNGKTTWSAGTYEEITPNEKIVYTDHFSDENGGIISPQEAGMKGLWPDVLFYVTVEFESNGPDQTEMHISHEGIPTAMHNDCVQGWSECIDKMQKLVEQH